MLTVALPTHGLPPSPARRLTAPAHPLTLPAGQLVPRRSPLPQSYDCSKCPGYCCSYPVIALEKRDVERLARHHGLDFEAARKAFTRSDHGRRYILKRKTDEHFGRICRFFDTRKRRCTIYEARPGVCRSHPGPRCGYYEFLKFEREFQDDPAYVAHTDHGDWR